MNLENITQNLPVITAGAIVALGLGGAAIKIVSDCIKAEKAAETLLQEIKKEYTQPHSKEELIILYHSLRTRVLPYLNNRQRQSANEIGVELEEQLGRYINQEVKTAVNSTEVVLKDYIDLNSLSPTHCKLREIIDGLDD